MLDKLLKNKHRKIIEVSLKFGDDKKNPDDEKTDLAPDVKDVGGGPSIHGAPNSEMSNPMQEQMMEADAPVMSPEEHDKQRIQMLENIGADGDHKNNKSLRGKAMYAAGQEMNKLKAKSKMLKKA